MHLLMFELFIVQRRVTLPYLRWTVEEADRVLSLLVELLVHEDLVEAPGKLRESRDPRDEPAVAASSLLDIAPVQASCMHENERPQREGQQ